MSRKYFFQLGHRRSLFAATPVFAVPSFYLGNQLDASLLPPDNELKKWSINGYIKQLPWDSSIIARYTQSKLTNNIDLTSHCGRRA